LKTGIGVAHAVADVEKAVEEAEGESLALVRTSLNAEVSTSNLKVSCKISQHLHACLHEDSVGGEDVTVSSTCNSSLASQTLKPGATVAPACEAHAHKVSGPAIALCFLC